MNIYKELLLDHYKNPRNAGTLENPTFTTRQYNPSCGDEISFQGIIKDNLLVEVSFTGKGCVISQAAASLLSEAVKNQPISMICTLAASDIQKLLHIDLGPLRLKCALLSLMALQEGICQERK